MTNILSNILEVFNAVADWIVEAVTGVMPMFYNTTPGEEGLTLLGVLAVAGLAISVALLLINLIKSFLRFQ